MRLDQEIGHWDAAALRLWLFDRTFVLVVRILPIALATFGAAATTATWRVTLGSLDDCASRRRLCRSGARLLAARGCCRAGSGRWSLRRGLRHYRGNRWVAGWERLLGRLLRRERAGPRENEKAASQDGFHAQGEPR